MTDLRDQFAVAALSGLAAVRLGKNKNVTAKMAWELADEMLAERDNRTADPFKAKDPRYSSEEEER